jgi:hypothetical protein
VYSRREFQYITGVFFFLQVLQGLEIASICVEDMDEWLGIFNIKLRHMREDIQSVRLFSPLLINMQTIFPSCYEENIFSFNA